MNKRDVLKMITPSPGLPASLPRASLASWVWAALSCFAGVVTASEQKPESSHLRTADAWLTEHAAPVTAEGADDVRFAKFGQAIAGRRIVALGEQSHGDGTVFKLKADLVRYLHEQQGFDALLLESGLFDVSEIWHAAATGGSVDELAPGSIFFMYARSSEAREALHYVDQSARTAHPLLLAGIDSSQTGVLSQRRLTETLRRFLLDRHSPLAEDPKWDAYARAVDRLTKLEKRAPPAERAAFFAFTQRLDDELCAPGQPDRFDFPESPSFWCRITRGLRAQASDYWTGTNLRDTEMAANVEWAALQDVQAAHIDIDQNLSITFALPDFDGLFYVENATPVTLSR